MIAATATQAQISTEAKAFMIWREGTSVGWDCTNAELAEATGISPTGVKRIRESRGWVLKQDGRGGDTGTVEVDRALITW